MAKINGQAVLWGAGVQTYTGGIVSASNAANPQSVSAVRDSGLVEVSDTNGDIATQVFHALKNTANITVVPYHATTYADGVSAAEAWSVSAGTTVSITDKVGLAGGSTHTLTNGLAGVWNVISSSQGRTNTGVGTIDLVLNRFDDTDVTTQVSA